MDSSDPQPLSPELLSAHAGFLSGLVSQLVHDDHDAADIVQETFLSAVKRPPDDRGAAQGWLAKVARNHALQSWRSRRRRRAREEWVARDERVPSAAEIVERETARRAVVEALVELAEPYRSALLLRFYEDLPPREVARRLGVPVETARTRIKRGLAQLRAALDRSFGSDRRRWTTALLPLAIPSAEKGVLPSSVWLVAAASLALVAAYFTWPADDRKSEERLARVLAPASELAAEARENAPPDDGGGVRRPADVDPRAARASLRVQVIGAEDGLPREGVSVTVEIDGQGFESAVSDGSGRVALPRPPSRELVLRAQPTETTLAGSRAVAENDEGADEIILAVPGASSVSGTAVDELGAPLSGVDVAAYALSEPELVPDLTAAPLASARTASGGAYDLRGLPRRFYLHAARGDGLVAVAGLAAVLDAPCDARDVAVVLQREWTASGRVADDAGRPLAGVEVRALAPDLRGTGRASGIRGASWRALVAPATSSRDDGAFELRGLAPRAQLVRASVAGYVEDLLAVQSDGAVLEFALPRAAELTLAVLAPGGEPVAGARVRLASSSDSTDASGLCKLAAPPGPCRLQVSAEGFANRVEDIEVAERSSSTRKVVLERARTLAGRVLEADGTPSPRARVLAQRDGRELERASADEEGRFVLSSLDSAPVELRVTAEGERAPRGEARDDGRAEIEIVLRAPLAAAVLLRGKALDARTREPVAEFRVTARGRTGRVSARGKGGVYELGAGAAGEWALAFTAEGYAPWTAGPRPFGAGEHELDVELWPAGAATVRLTDRNGSPIEDARLLVEDTDGRPLAARIREEWWSNLVPVGPGGEARLEGLPAREVLVRVRLADFDPTQVFRIDLAAPRERPEPLVLDVDRSGPMRDVELAISGAPRDVAVHVEVSSRGETSASFDCRVSDGLWTVERPVRCLLLRFSRSGDPLARSLQTLASDTLARDLGPRIEGDDSPTIRLRLPAEACEVVVSAPGRATRRLELPEASASPLAVVLDPP